MASIQVGERINQLRLAYATGITPITIRKRSSDIAAIMETIDSAHSLLESLREEEREDASSSEESLPLQGTQGSGSRALLKVGL